MDMVWILGIHSDLLRYIGLCGSLQPEVTGYAQFYVNPRARFGFIDLAARATLGAQA